MIFPLIRYLSKPLTPLLAWLPVSANQITAASLVAGLACAWAVSKGRADMDVVGAVLLVVTYVLDNCDGEIARLKGQCSDFGMRFDTFVDWLVHTAFFAALGMGYATHTGQDIWLWLGLTAAVGSTINYGVGFMVEARDRRRTQQDGTAVCNGHEAPNMSDQPNTIGDWFVFAFRELSRADFCFIVLALALADVLWVLVPAGAIGAQVYWILQFIRGAQDYHV